MKTFSPELTPTVLSENKSVTQNLERGYIDEFEGYFENQHGVKFNLILKPEVGCWLSATTNNYAYVFRTEADIEQAKIFPKLDDITPEWIDEGAEYFYKFAEENFHLNKGIYFEVSLGYLETPGLFFPNWHLDLDIIVYKFRKAQQPLENLTADEKLLFEIAHENAQEIVYMSSISLYRNFVRLFKNGKYKKLYQEALDKDLE